MHLAHLFYRVVLGVVLRVDRMLIFNLASGGAMSKNFWAIALWTSVVDFTSPNGQIGLIMFSDQKLHAEDGGHSKQKIEWLILKIDS